MNKLIVDPITTSQTISQVTLKGQEILDAAKQHGFEEKLLQGFAFGLGKKLSEDFYSATHVLMDLDWPQICKDKANEISKFLTELFNSLG